MLTEVEREDEVACREVCLSSLSVCFFFCGAVKLTNRRPELAIRFFSATSPVSSADNHFKHHDLAANAVV